MRKRSLALAAAAASILLTPQHSRLRPRPSAPSAAWARTPSTSGSPATAWPRSASARIPSSEIAGKNGTWGAVGAPDNPARGLSGVKAAHCDGGDYFASAGYPQSQVAAATELTR